MLSIIYHLYLYVKGRNTGFFLNQGARRSHPRQALAPFFGR